jgi:hypothetical protein
MEMLPVEFARLQLAAVEGWLNAAALFWKECQHLTQLNLELMRPAAFQRWHDVVPTGAEWTDHYGRRSHDVDVEHIR